MGRRVEHQAAEIHSLLKIPTPSRDTGVDFGSSDYPQGTVDSGRETAGLW